MNSKPENRIRTENSMGPVGCEPNLTHYLDPEHNKKELHTCILLDPFLKITKMIDAHHSETKRQAFAQCETCKM
jgi:hypothetical protein